MTKTMVEVMQITDKDTKNGNRIVKLTMNETVTDELGDSDLKATYYRAVKSKTLRVKVGQKLEIDLDKYHIVERPYVNEDGSLPVDDEGKVIDDGNGNPRMLKWIYLRK